MRKWELAVVLIAEILQSALVVSERDLRHVEPNFLHRSRVLAAPLGVELKIYPS